MVIGWAPLVAAATDKMWEEPQRGYRRVAYAKDNE